MTNPLPGARKSRLRRRFGGPIALVPVVAGFIFFLAAGAASRAQEIAGGFHDLQAGPGSMVNVPGRGDVLEIQNTDASTSVLRSLPLPAREVAGRVLRVGCDVSAENISAKPQLWNGIKLMAHIVYPGGELWPEANLPVGTFAVRPVFVRFEVPASATEVTLIFGLEKVTGSVGFSGLNVAIGPVFVPAPAAPPDQPIFTGHDVPRLRGAMADPTMTEQDLATFADQWHGNLIRWQLLRGEPSAPESNFAAYDAWLDGALARTDLVLGWAARHHVKVVLDLHTPPGGRGWTTGSLFGSPAAQAHFVEVWRKMAARYKGNNTIWGFDLVNEPNDDETAPDCKDWQGLALDGARAVREVDPDRTLIIEPCKYGGAGGFTYFNPLPLAHVVYSFHMYEPLTFTHQGVFHPNDGPFTYPGPIDGKLWNRDALAAAMQPAVDFARRYRVQLYVGEFSAIRWAPGADRYLADVTSLFEEHGWDWSYHAYREWQGWNLELGAGKGDLTPPPVPTARFNVIEHLLQQNELPAQ